MTKIKPSEDLAYWVGVIQTDGCYYKPKERLELSVHKKSLPMLIKFQKISKLLTGKPIQIHKIKDGRYHCYLYGLEFFKKLKNKGISFIDPPVPPR